MIKIDGSAGEGGGQILRTSLSLSMLTGQPFKIENIRAGRKKPGLLRQHLTAVQAAATISNAEVSGDRLQSQELTFYPGSIQAGDYSFSISTAGSITLVFQTIFPALLKAVGHSSLKLSGGTHNPFAPPFHFLQKAFGNVINKMGLSLSFNLNKYGFYPAGGGEFTVDIPAGAELKKISLEKRGAILSQNAIAISSQIPDTIGQREMKIVSQKLNWDPDLCKSIMTKAFSPGNIVLIFMEYENISEVFTGFGEVKTPLAKVAAQAVSLAREYLKSDAVAGQYLADQLMLPMVIAGGGSFTTIKVTRHTLTNIEVFKKFIDITIRIEQIDSNLWNIKIGA